jgi:hypothetical protein
VASTEPPPAQPVTGGAAAPQGAAKDTKTNETTGTVTVPANPATAPADPYDYE